MAFFRTIALCMVTLIILAACSFAPKPGKPQSIPKSSKSEELNKGGLFYSAGITYYEEGEYEPAEKNLNSALALGLADPGDKIKAHKYLAFIYCVSGRQVLCENEFKKVFELDPGFTLSPAEAGHPMWQPVYDKVKSQMAPVKKTP
ncbi:MAG: TssQ family T6SS-associated lipoprotein [Deltaproteobacteria bacterium]|nr:TssQ family T6SS-associated lipoprotein [Deltaproteobacteria bacterium]